MAPVSQPGTAEKSSKRRLLIVGIVLGAIVLWIVPWVVFVVKVAGGLSKVGEKIAGPIVTIAEETTRIVEPLDEEGYVDYIAALNDGSRQGVTPENNAAVPLWQAIGPAELLRYRGTEDWRWFFEELGISPLPEEGEYFVSLDEHARELDVAGPPPGGQRADEDSAGMVAPDTWWSLLDEQSDRAGARPWSREEFPELAAWLDRNEAPLGLAVEGSGRERFYSPLICSGRPRLLVNTLLPASFQCRYVCRALTDRAMLRLHEGDSDGARRDLLACHRWARLVGQEPTLIEALVAYGIDGVACTGDAAVARQGNLSSDEIRQYRLDLEKLGPLPTMADRLDAAERYQLLDSMVALARWGPAMLDSSDAEENQLDQLLWERGVNRAVDWDAILRMENQHLDRVVETARIADRPERAVAIRELEEEIEGEAKASTHWTSLAKSFLGKGPRKTVTEKIGQVFLVLLMPALSSALESEDRAVVTSRLADTALALAAYRADHGGYPERLADLVPDYLEEVPRDVFTGDELRYALLSDDYLLYSVGPNGEDERGRTYESEPKGDDVVIQDAPE